MVEEPTSKTIAPLSRWPTAENHKVYIYIDKNMQNKDQ